MKIPESTCVVYEPYFVYNFPNPRKIFAQARKKTLMGLCFHFFCLGGYFRAGDMGFFLPATPRMPHQRRGDAHWYGFLRRLGKSRRFVS